MVSGLLAGKTGVITTGLHGGSQDLSGCLTVSVWLPTDGKHNYGHVAVLVSNLEPA